MWIELGGWPSYDLTLSFQLVRYLMRIILTITVILLFILFSQYFYVEICFIIAVYIGTHKPAFTFWNLPQTFQNKTLQTDVMY